MARLKGCIVPSPSSPYGIAPALDNPCGNDLLIGCFHPASGDPYSLVPALRSVHIGRCYFQNIEGCFEPDDDDGTILRPVFDFPEYPNRSALIANCCIEESESSSESSSSSEESSSESSSEILYETWCPLCDKKGSPAYVMLRLLENPLINEGCVCVPYSYGCYPVNYWEHSSLIILRPETIYYIGYFPACVWRYTRYFDPEGNPAVVGRWDCYCHSYSYSSDVYDTLVDYVVILYINPITPYNYALGHWNFEIYVESSQASSSIVSTIGIRTAQVSVPAPPPPYMPPPEPPLIRCSLLYAGPLIEERRFSNIPCENNYWTSTLCVVGFDQNGNPIYGDGKNQGKLCYQEAEIEVLFSKARAL